MARGSRSPTVEVLIRDEVTAALERERNRIRAAAGNNELFSGLQAGFAGLESSIQSLAQTVRREFGTLLRMTGAGGFLGAGFVAGITKASEAISGLARVAEQNRYLADTLGLTSAQLANLSARGQALGMSAEQSKAGIASLANALRELKVRGADASVYKALDQAGGASGRGFGNQLIAAVRGPGGYEAGIRLFSKQMAGMNSDAQRKLREIFNVSSLAFRDLYSPGANDLPTILDLVGPQARRLNVAMASLGISFDNLKTTLGGALMPAFEQLSRTLDQFLQGPGDKLVQQFADWASTLNIPWDSIAKALVGAVETLGSIFDAGKKAIADGSEAGGKVETWAPILLKFGKALIPGFVQHLASLGKALSFVGAQKDVVDKIAAAMRGGGAAAPAMPAAPAAPANARPQRMGRADDDQLPMAAQPVSFMSGASGFVIPGYATEQDDANELSAQVKGTQEQVLRLASYVSSLALTTDPTGAGGLAALAGQIRARAGGGGDGVTFRPGIRGGGGGGGRRRGGGGDDRAPTTGPAVPDDTSSTGPTSTGRGEASPRSAVVRLNNPGAATAPSSAPSYVAAAGRFGSQGAQKLPGGGRTPSFPTAVHGAAYNMWFLSQSKWRNKTIAEIMWEWSGHNRRWAAGFKGNERLTDEALKDPLFMAKLIMGIAAGEVSGKYPLSIDQLKQAHDWFMAGGVPAGATALTRDGTYQPSATNPQTTQPTPAQPSPIVWSNQDEIDALKKEEWEREHFPVGGFTPIPGRSSNINLNVNVRGRNARVTSDSSGAMSAANVSRDKSDPSGGIPGFSPG